MNEKSMVRERMAWTAAVAVLASSLAWLGVINLTLVVAAHGSRMGFMVVIAKAIAQATLAVLASVWPLLLAALVAAGLLVVVAQASRRGTALEEGMRHA